MLPIGSSESGNPICCAVASKVLDIMREEHIVEHVAEVAKYAKERLEREFLPLAYVGSISGLGLMLGFDIVVDKKTKAIPGTEVMAEIQSADLSRDYTLEYSVTDFVLVHHW